MLSLLIHAALGALTVVVFFRANATSTRTSGRARA